MERLTLRDIRALDPKPSNDAASGRSLNRARKPNRMPLLASIFVVTLLLPINFYIGPMRLSPYRFVLLAVLVPLFVALISGRLTRIYATDVFIIVYSAWSTIAILLSGDINSTIQPSGMFVIETLGAYLVGRVAIRTEEDFTGLAGLLFKIVIILMPFAIIESLTNQAVIIDLLKPYFSVPPKIQQEMRLGLYRAQVVFEHSILYGSFVASIFGITYCVGGNRGMLKRNGKSFFVICAAFLSLSSGAIAATVVQLFLLAWNAFTKAIPYRWRVLTILLAIVYFTIDLLSSRSPFHVMVSYLTLSSGNYDRILIWQYGTENVWHHPLFGIGLGDWERPSWMSSSMDNFWLVVAVQHGLPAFLFIALAIVFMFKGIGVRKFTSPNLINCRAGLFISLAGLVVGAATVDYWNALYCWFMFMIGSGMWMLKPELDAQLPKDFRRASLR